MKVLALIASANAVMLNRSPFEGLAIQTALENTYPVRSTWGPAPEDEQWPAMQQASDSHADSEKYVSTGHEQYGTAYMNDLLTMDP